jgi:hypothetical protein
MKDDPLAGLTSEQRHKHEWHCAGYFRTYKPEEHTGWLAEELSARRLIIHERFDLDHPAQIGLSVTRVQCVDCGADLQSHEPPGRPATKTSICLACAYRRASFDC